MKGKFLNWKVWLGLLISSICLYLAFRGTEPGESWAVIRTADLSFLFLAVIVTFFQFVVRAWRWKRFLLPIKETSFANRLSSTLIGFAANCVLPARMGEFIRAGYLGKTEKISGSSSFGTIVVERFFDGFTLLLVLLIGIMTATFPEELGFVSGKLRNMGLLMFFFYVLVIIFLAGIKYRTGTFLNFFNSIFFFLPDHMRTGFLNMVNNFSQGLVIIKGISSWIQMICYSFLIWGLGLLQISLINQSIGLELPFISTFLMLSIASFGVLIPSAPGYIGTFHAAVRYGLLLFGVSSQQALPAAIIWHAVFFFPTIVFGLLALLYLQIVTGRSWEYRDNISV